MRIREFQIRRHSLELRKPLRTASGELRRREGAVIEMIDGTLSGLGEATPLSGPWVEVLDDSLRAIAHGASALVGEELPEDAEGIDARLEADPALSGTPAARHALECALLDLAAKRRGLPLRRLLSDRARDTVQVNALLTAHDPAALADEARSAVAEGFGSLKLKVGFGREVDLRRVEAVRRAAGPDVRIRVDANGAWQTNEAEENLRVLGALGLELCEQPVPARDIDALRSLRGRVPCAVAADEALALPEGPRAVLAEPPAADLLVLKPMVLGGLVRTLCWARHAHARGVGSFVTTSLDGPVALAAAAHLAASLPSADWACGLGTARHFAGDAFAGAPEPRAGVMRLDDSPGLGLRAGRVR